MPKINYCSFEIVIEREPEDQGYLAYSPTLPGCFSNGLSIEEVKRNIREAIEQHLATLLAHTGVDLGRGLAARILKDAGFTVEEFIRWK